MSITKITLLIITIFSITSAYSQTVEQDFTALDKNKDGKIDKSEFQTPPPPPPSPASKQRSSAGAVHTSEKSEATSSNEDRSVKKEEIFQEEVEAKPTFESIDTNGDGVIDMNEFKLNHTIVRKRPGATRKSQ